MFEPLNSFWGGAVSLAGGLMVFFTLFKAISARPKRIAHDFRSELILAPKTPLGFEVCFQHDGKSYSTIHKTELLIKNETQSPLTDESFLTPPTLDIGSAELC
jgi:hypothetical protein